MSFSHGSFDEASAAHASGYYRRNRTGHLLDELQDGVEMLNRMLVGWGNYFCLGPVSNAYSAVDQHVRTRLRRWLCDKHKVQRPGYKRFPEAALNDVFGLVSLPRRTASLPWAKA